MSNLTIEQRVRIGAATLQELADLGAERVGEIKSDGEHTHYRGSSFVALKADDASDASGRKILRVIASTSDKDHYGDRVSVRSSKHGSGWKIEDYKRQGGVYLWSHNLGSTKAPIGQALKTWTGKVGKAADGMNAAGLDPDKMALMQDVEFLSADDGPDDHFKFAETIYLLMSGKGTRSGKGMMGSSVGFVPVKVRVPENKDQREQLDLGPYGVHFDEQVLLENSATPTPANPFASVIGDKKSFEANVLAELDYIEDQALLPKSLVSDFRKRAVLGPTDAAEKLAERLASRIFVFSKDSSTTVPDGFDRVVHADDETDFDKLVADSLASTQPPTGVEKEIEAPAPREDKLVVKARTDEAGETSIVIDDRARAIIERAYDAADFAMAALGVVLDAVDEKNTDPDFKSSFGEGNAMAEIGTRLDGIESALKALAESRSQTTEPRDRETPFDPDELTRDLAQVIADAVAGK